jgi:hypothetical protein
MWDSWHEMKDCDGKKMVVWDVEYIYLKMQITFWHFHYSLKESSIIIVIETKNSTIFSFFIVGLKPFSCRSKALRIKIALFLFSLSLQSFTIIIYVISSISNLIIKTLVTYMTITSQQTLTNLKTVHFEYWK